MSTVKKAVKKSVKKVAKKSVNPSQETLGKMVSGEIRTAEQVKQAKAKDSIKKVSKPSKKAAAETAAHDGTVVGYAAKSQEDVKWTELKVAFYKALKRIGGAGTSAKIAQASNGKIHAGHARHFGYHGVGGGLIKVEKAGGPNSKEGDRGFIFVLTAKGRKVDPDAELKKQAATKE